MPRRRMISPEFWTDGKVTSCCRDARLLFIGLWNFSDDAGRSKDDPRELKNRIFPSDGNITPSTVKALLDELIGTGMVKRYSANGADYIYIPHFLDHQKIKNPSESLFPTPPLPQDYPPPTPALPQEIQEKGREGGEGGRGVGGKRREEKLSKLSKLSKVKEVKKGALPPDPRVSLVMKELEKERGYISPCHAAETSPVKWMLDHGYSQEEIMACWRDLKREPFWEGKELLMASVKKQIGAWKAKPRGRVPAQYQEGD